MLKEDYSLQQSVPDCLALKYILDHIETKSILVLSTETGIDLMKLSAVLANVKEFTLEEAALLYAFHPDIADAAFHPNNAVKDTARDFLIQAHYSLLREVVSAPGVTLIEVEKRTSISFNKLKQVIARVALFTNPELEKLQSAYPKLQTEPYRTSP